MRDASLKQRIPCIICISIFRAFSVEKKCALYRGKYGKLDIEETPTSKEELPDEEMICGNVTFDDAKDAELANWRNHDVYEEILDEGQKCISTRWVSSLKEDDSGITQKARLVSRGFEEDILLQSDSPTCGNESLRIVLAIIAQK